MPILVPTFIQAKEKDIIYYCLVICLYSWYNQSFTSQLSFSNFCILYGSVTGTSDIPHRHSKPKFNIFRHGCIIIFCKRFIFRCCNFLKIFLIVVIKFLIILRDLIVSVDERKRSFFADF